jgi:ubiquinone/menaquinone biosynthesis C-methylase UbiE
MPIAPSGHLDYYTRHGINPVRYDTANLQRHLERRGALYRMLGVTPLAIRNARILEVAPGTGQNSLYITRHKPESFTFVEPNPVAVRDIAAVYAELGEVAPDIVVARFEAYESDERFDIVVCENWLGSSGHDRQVLHKLGRYVDDEGLLVITAVSPVGILPNLLRRALANRLTQPDKSFAEKTSILCRAFGPHLRTIAAMTRGVTDWVQDNMLNPAYFGIVLTVPMVIIELGSRFDVLGSSPSFAVDWRWFKGLCGTDRDFNGHVLGEYRKGLHNFFDHRTVLPPRDSILNAEFEAAALAVCEAVERWEAGDINEDGVEMAVRRVLGGIGDLPAAWSVAFDEFLDAFAQPRLTPETVAELTQFGSLFGRETIYLSFEKRLRNGS